MNGAFARPWYALAVCLSWIGLACAGAAANAQPPERIAIATDVAGEVACGRSKGKGMRHLALLDEVGAGDDVVLKPGAVLVLAYVKTGDEFRITGPARITLATDGPQPRTGAAPQRFASPLASEAVKLAGASGLVIQAAVRMRSVQGEGVRLLRPEGRVLEIPKRFEWVAPDRTERFNFELVDVETGDSVVATTVDGGEFALPAGSQLLPGGRYSWSIEFPSARGGTRSMKQEFSVASQAERDHFESLRPAPGAPFADRVMYAALLKQAGIDGESRGLWKALANDRPGSTVQSRLAAP